ncbi:AraC family transcriptional regulator [Georgenia alba]|uniref:Helix-turn-helix domain-containing protein n=1 Tax=Georgenia alba TaxID=2233858 RepID=A0ABW2Q949_9MICO
MTDDGAGLRHEVLCGPGGRHVRIWASESHRPTAFTSVAGSHPGLAFTRVGGTTWVTVRGPETRATQLPVPADAEFFGVDLRLGAYLRMHPPGGLRDLNDQMLSVLPDDRFLLAGEAWQMPTPQNVDVLLDRLARAGVLAFDPAVEDIRHGEMRGLSARTAQERFTRAVGISRRTHAAIERAHRAAHLLRRGTPLAAVVYDAGYYDQPHLTRALRRFVGHTPGEVAAGGLGLDLGPA